MCLTLDALVVFLGFLPMDIIETKPDQIIVHAQAQDAVWVATGDLWCVDTGAVDTARLLSEEPLISGE